MNTIDSTVVSDFTKRVRLATAKGSREIRMPIDEAVDITAILAHLMAQIIEKEQKTTQDMASISGGSF